MDESLNGTGGDNDNASRYFHTDESKQLWFMEKGSLWPGQAFGIRVQEILHHQRSEYQDVLVFKSTNYGTVLVLDGVIQVTERDEFSYQEMIAHLPLNAHPCPKNVLVIGGGDGGVLREIVKHKSVETVTLCEIDKDVITASKRYLPSLATGFDSPKVRVHIGDGFKFLADSPGLFDIIITDSSDPVGPAESLFQDSFFELVKSALKPGGIICSQGECQWLHLDIIETVHKKVWQLFPRVEYAFTTIPTYPSGQIGFILCSLDSSIDLSRVHPDKSQTGMSPEDLGNLRYYNHQIHSASFVLPQFTRKMLDKVKPK